jgi:hypothetical protein
MELGRACIYILIVMMSINAVSSMMGYVGIEGVPLSAYNQTQFREAMNSTETVENWSWQTEFWDVAYGLTTWWYKTLPLIEAFPAMLAAHGCPSFIYNPLHDIWRFIWMATITLVIISGRRL